MMNVISGLLAKGALSNFIEGVNSKNFSLAPLACSKPRSFHKYNVIDLHAFFCKEPTSRPSSKSSLFVDLKSANCSTKSSLIVP